MQDGYPVASIDACVNDYNAPIVAARSAVELNFVILEAIGIHPVVFRFLIFSFTFAHALKVMFGAAGFAGMIKPCAALAVLAVLIYNPLARVCDQLNSSTRVP